MISYYTTIQFETKIDDIIRLDTKIQTILESETETDSINGIVTAFVPGSTGALSTIEYEPGLLKDFPEAMNEIVPDKDYYHNTLNYDDNGKGHIKSTIVGPSITIPFVNKRLKLGTWQQIVFLEFDTHSRSRKVEIMVLGTK